MTPRGHFQVIWRRRWLILLATVLIAGGVYGFSATRAKTYRAQGQLNVVPGQPANDSSPVSQDTTVFLTNTYTQLGQTRPVVTDAVHRSGLHISEETAVRRLSVTASNQVGFINVAATGPTPDQATALARGEIDALTATVTAQQSSSLQRSLAPVQQQIATVGAQLATLPPGSATQAAVASEYQALVQSATTKQLAQTNQINVVSPARADSAPVSPNPARDALLAFVTALVLNAELAVGLELLSDRFPGEELDEEIRRVTGLPVLAHVPRAEGPNTLEAFRTLRTNLLFMETEKELHSVAVVSPEPGTGKSFTSINLATAIAELGMPVVLVDADLRRPAVDTRLGVPASPGLTDVLRGLDPSKAMHRVGGRSGLLAMPAGGQTPDPAGLLGKRLRQRLLAAPGTPNIKIVDTPAESLFPDALACAVHCDATLVVIDGRMSRRRAVRHLLERLRQVNAKPLGVVVNRAKLPSRRYGYYSYYGNGNGHAEQPAVESAGAGTST